MLVRAKDKSPKKTLSKESEQWSVKIRIDLDGGVSQLNSKTIEKLNDYGFNSIYGLLPKPNNELVNICRHNNKQQFVTGKIGDKMFSWEYSPTR